MTLFAEYEPTSTAAWSPCRIYRYTLTRRWGPGPLVNWLLLNPSTADEWRNDPTVAGCIKRAVLWGFGGLVVTNLFAYRATDPLVMKAFAAPVGPENDRHLIEQAQAADLVICGWGEDGPHLNRSAEVVAILQKAGVTLHALKLNKSGQPQHPLYIAHSVKPVIWTP